MKVASMFVLNNATGKVKAYGKLEVEGGLVIDGFRVIEGTDGLWVGWPNKEVVKNGEKNYYPVVACEDEDKKKEVSQMFLDHYRDELASRGVRSKPAPVAQQDDSDEDW